MFRHCRIELYSRKLLVKSLKFSRLLLEESHIDFVSRRWNHHVCVIGSGPAGFYAAQHLVKLKQSTYVDIFEKLPVPFGLVRYGVAPDHPEVKNVINTFHTVLKNPNVRFLGNIEAGKDVTFQQLKKSYDAILLCYGACEDRKLEIPGEKELVTSARDFVGWYNGLPANRDLQIDLSNKKRAIIIGQGNVALDIARILLSPISALEKTDISPYALETLRNSKIEEIAICGRRGPLQVSFTIKELREQFTLEGVKNVLNMNDFHGVNDEVIKNLPRPRKRLTELMWATAKGEKVCENYSRKCIFQFYRSPINIDKHDGGLRLMLAVNEPLKDNPEKIVQTNQTEVEMSDIVFRSVGYKGRRVFTEIPFDDDKGIVPNVGGKVEEGVYCSGWVGQGPRGVILSTMQNAFDVAKKISQDLESIAPRSKSDIPNIHSIVKDKRITTFSDYEKIAHFEKENGRKVTTINEMLLIANNDTNNK